MNGCIRRRGVTLIEVMISMVLISTILLVSLTASANLRRNIDQRHENSLGQQLAGQILDEVSSADFRDRSGPSFGLEAGETATDRRSFDDVDDYHGYASSPPTHRDGSMITGYEGWSFSVAVIQAEPDTTGITTLAADPASPLRRIVVTCTAPDGTTTTAEALVSDVPSDISDGTSYQRWRRVKLTFPDRVVDVTAPLRNQPDSLTP